MNSDSSSSNELALLPQYGFGATYAFDALVEHHHFLYRVHTPKRPGTLSRPASPSPRARSPFHRPELTRSPSSLSSSVASIRTADIGASDYFAFVPGHPGDEDDSASGDPYFLSRRFKDDLTSPDPGRRRRTLSTLSTLSSASTARSYFGSDDGSDVEYELGPRAKRGNLSRSTSMMLGHSRVRSDSMSNSRPDAKRSQSANIRQSALPTESTEVTGGANMTYTDLVRHLDWTTRSSSPYVTTSFSFFWCLWEAVRRYKLGVKHDVEIAVIDARKVRGRAKTALEVLRNVEADRQDKAYWKWFRFAQESQDVLVFGAIPGDAIYASIPLTQILPKLPSYFFVDDIPKALEDPREPDADIDPRSPSSRQTNPIFPSTPGRPETPNRERERERERKFTAHLLTTLAWDIGTTLKPTRKSKDAINPTPGKPTPRHTSHADFCKALSASFAKRSEADQLRDATTGVVNLAELLVEPWFRARCAEGAAYLFRHDDDDELDDEKDVNADRRSLSESVCLGLAGDGCALEHSHDSSIQDALFGADKDDETEEEAAKREAAGVLSELALSLARWPANWWYEEHAGTVEGLVGDVVSMCVTEAARGVQGRIAWGIALEGERERRRTSSMSGSVRSRADSSMNLSGSLTGSLRSERRGREETRERERERSRSPFAGTGLKQARRASEGSPSPKQLPLRESPYKPRARSPLGTTPALGPAIVIRPKSKPKAEGQSTSEPKPAQEQEVTQAWSPSTPPPSPPLKFSVSEGNLGNATPSRRKSPPHPPPPRSNKRPPSPSQSISSSLASLDSPSPSPNSSPSASLSSSLLKRSVQRRAESLPGGWPGDESPREERSESPNEQPVASKKEEGDVFWDPAARSQTKARPLSWAGSGMALGAVSSAPNSVAGSQKSSVESLRNTIQSSPSSSPSSSILRQRPRTSSDAQAREALLTEVVSSALGLGVGVVAGASGIASSGSPLRLDTASSSSSGSERSLGSSHHRRHSSHGHVHPLDIELSPVREVEQEDEVEVEAEQGNLEGTTAGDESARAVYGEGNDASVGVAGSKPVPERVQANGVDTNDESKTDGFASDNASGKEVITSGSVGEVILADQPAEDHLASPQGSGTSTPRSERRRSRSGTLASIPEENWTEWSLVEAPTASELEADANQREASLDSSVVEPVDIPLPPSPSLETTELSDDVHSPLPGVIEPTGATKAGEEQGASNKAEVRQVPEITLTTDTAPSAAAEEQSLAEESDSLEAGAGTSKAEEKSNALADSRHFGLPVSAVALARTRTLMRTFIALPVVNLFRSLFPGQESRFPSPSPVFEDTDAADAYLRMSPFFSFFRIPIRATTRFFRRRRQELCHLKPGRSMAKILSPPAAWDSPILESYPYAEHSANAVRGEGGYWDDQDTNWVMSCFVCGVMATLALASIQQQRCEMHMMVGNRLH